MTNFEIRQSFIDFFKSREHTHVPSSSLIPEKDPTLLFANAGMNQFKNVFLGLEQRPYSRAVSAQKCLRAGGKHNDLEQVGHTTRHHTFFEMLGNFSFGDYFKKDAIHFAWQYLTKDLLIPKDRLYVTVFQDDDEAADIWHKQEQVPRDKIFRFGEKDNFWRMADTGPCGPCSEIFFDHGPRAGKIADPYQGILAGEDRFVEIWNLVFMQYFEESPGNMRPLPNPSVDTGAGLERLTTVLQGKLSNYDTDCFLPLIKELTLLTGIEYLEHTAITTALSSETLDNLAAMRVLADHARSTTFLISDGVMPANEGRGYVLRRIMRRAIRYGRKLSDKSLLPNMIQTFVEHMGRAYPELKNRYPHIVATVKDEEERFLNTLDQGTEILTHEINRLLASNEKILPGNTVFKLYDTYGFPADLTRLIAQEHNLDIDEKNFEELMTQARQKARASWKGEITQNEKHLIEFCQKARDLSIKTDFVGYANLATQGTVMLLSNGEAIQPKLKAGEQGILILNRTPFYAESGGQIGDRGEIRSSSVRATVHDCKKLNNIHCHFVEVFEGELESKKEYELVVSASHRRNVAANHSATHLLHAALRECLGEHVTQAGSLVEPHRLRFDFTFPRPVSEKELAKIAAMVNKQIAKSLTVTFQNMNYKEALKSGAIALFGEKYGDEVRVVQMGIFATELCGGTHVANTAMIRCLYIVSETGVSAGVRRIEAITGEKAVEYFLKNTEENQQARRAAGAQDNWLQYLGDEASGAKSFSLIQWIEDRKKEIKDLQKELTEIKGNQINIADLIKNGQAFTLNNTSGTFIWTYLPVSDRKILTQIVDRLKEQLKNAIIIVIGKGDDAHPIIAAVSPAFTKAITAGKLIEKIAACTGGKGGGRPDFAQGAIVNLKNLDQAKKEVWQLLY